jgi:restriction system protein
MDYKEQASELIFSAVFPIFVVVGGGMMVLIIITILIDLMKKKSKVRWLLNKKKIEDIQSLTPYQFEEYISQLFKKMGYKTKTVGGRNDGGIDVEAEKGGVISYIQCKKYINRKVPVGAVRDFYGATVDKIGSGKGYFITTNVFTLEAERFAEDKPIELIDRFKLIEYIKNRNIKVPEIDYQKCPKCRGVLVQRKGKYGDFMGCSNYPKCRYTKEVKNSL